MINFNFDFFLFNTVKEYNLLISGLKNPDIFLLAAQKPWYISPRCSKTLIYFSSLLKNPDIFLLAAQKPWYISPRCSKTLIYFSSLLRKGFKGTIVNLSYFKITSTVLPCRIFFSPLFSIKLAGLTSFRFLKNFKIFC